MDMLAHTEWRDLFCRTSQSLRPHRTGGERNDMRPQK
jgi:hypothetical protein